MQAEGISEAPEYLQITDEHNELIRLLPFATMRLSGPRPLHDMTPTEILVVSPLRGKDLGLGILEAGVWRTDEIMQEKLLF